MNDKIHEQLIDVVSTIGGIAEMPHWATAGLAAKIDPDQDIKEITIGELLEMETATAKHINKALS